MSAPIIVRLENRIYKCTCDSERAVLRLQRAIYLVRTSGANEIFELPGQIRAEFIGRETSDIYVMLWLLEALICFYKTGTTTGRSWLHRACSLADASKLTDLSEYVSAWMAHFDIVDDSYQNAIQCLIRSNLNMARLPEAASRASLVVASAWQACDETALATAWFSAARDIARRIGDQATIMASISNRASIRLNNIWIEQWFSKNRPINLREIELELMGALGYERFTESEALSEQGIIFRARLDILNSRFDEALTLLDSIGSMNMTRSYSILLSVRPLQLWLRVVSKKIDIHEINFDDTLISSISNMESDDAAVSWLLLAEVSKMCGDMRRYDKYISRAKIQYLIYNKNMNNLRDSLRMHHMLLAPSLGCNV